MSEKTENEEKMSDNASASSGSDQGPSSRQHTMVSFLKPVLKQIIMAGKSMQLLKNLRCVQSAPGQAAARGSPFLPSLNIAFVYLSRRFRDRDRQSSPLLVRYPSGHNNWAGQAEARSCELVSVSKLRCPMRVAECQLLEPEWGIEPVYSTVGCECFN